MAKKATKAAPGAAEIAAYVVAAGRNIEHDGDRYEAGEPIELTGLQAQPLLDCGAIEKAAPAA